MRSTARLAFPKIYCCVSRATRAACGDDLCRVVFRELAPENALTLRVLERYVRVGDVLDETAEAELSKAWGDRDGKLHFKQKRPRSQRRPPPRQQSQSGS